MRINSVVRLTLVLLVALLTLTGRAAQSGITSDAVSQADASSAPLSTSESSPLISVESLNLSICDSRAELESSWIQLQSCKTELQKVITWPLFSFPKGKDPKAMQFEKCFSDNQVPCGFNDSPKYWWVGPLTKDGPELRPNPQNIKFPNPLSQPELQSRKDQLNGLLFYLESQMAPVELAWRLGQSQDANVPLFSLQQGTGQSQASVALGNCGSLSLGKVRIGSITVNLKTECELHGSAPDDIVRRVAKRSARYFHWKLEEDDPDLVAKVNADDSAEFMLFPYKIAKFEGGHGIQRNGVPVPAESSSFLVSLHTPLVMILPKPPEFPYVVVTGFIILIGANAFSLFLSLRQRRNTASLSVAKTQTRQVRRPGGSAAISQIEGTPDVFPDTESSLPTQKDAIAGIQEVIAHLARIEGSLPELQNASKRREDDLKSAKAATKDVDTRLKKLEGSLLGLQEITKRCDEDLENARAAAKTIDTRMRDLETKNADLGPRVTSLAQHIKGTSAEVRSLDTELRRVIDARIEKATLEWSSVVLFDTTAPDFPKMSQAAIAQPGVAEADVEKILRPLYELSTFAREILRAWLTVNPLPMDNMEGDELGKRLSADLKVLEAVVHLERPLWSWWLGELPSSNVANIVVRVATSKWSSLPATQQDAARLALQWADDRVPRIQTLVEAAPIECGSNDPAGLRKALIQAASKLSCSTDDDDDVINLSKISKVFHALVENIYNAAGAQYLPVRLYQDTIQSHDIPSFIEETHAAYPFTHSDLLVDKRIAGRHGLVVRITQPLSRRRDRSSGKSKWEGSLYFLETRKPNA